MSSIQDIAPFDVLEPLPRDRLALEASAGTGKTWTIAALVVRYVADGVATLDELLIVTFTRAATAELRDRVRRRLSTALGHLVAVAAGGDQHHDDPVLRFLGQGPVEEVQQRAARLARALSGFDAATITTIHGFCHRVLATAGFAGDVDGSGAVVEDVDDLVRAATHDLLVSHWVDVPVDGQDDRPSPPTAETVARLALREPDVEVRPDPDDEEEPATGRALSRLALELRDLVDRRKRALGLVTFDDILLRLHRSLQDPSAGDTIRTAMRRRFRIALIDEFQDTDPVQWSILRDLFADRALILIGDPKQAIYRFRGADVHAYLEAVDDPRTVRATLATNHRSDLRLVGAVNRLFAGTSFGDPRIVHRQVGAAHTDDRLHLPDGPQPVLQLRAQLTDGGADASRSRIAADLAAEVTRLLAVGATLADPTATGRRPLAPGDCAVLVRSNAQAEDVKAALTAAGVHAVINGVGSVLESAAARDWHTLLEALERPSAASRARALALSPVVGLAPDAIAGLDDAGEAALHDRVHRWARVAEEHGVASLVRRIQRETGLLARMLGQEGGDRWLADFEHVGELLHGAATSERLGPSALIGWLADQASRTEELPADQRARRLESDDRAVQILTIHRAKGLQFPVVFCPFVMSTGQRPRVPHRFRDPHGHTPTIDVGSSAESDARARVRDEELGEQLRLLYVAMTRAEHRLVTWWWPFNARRKGYCESALSKLLFCPDDAGGRVRSDRDAPRIDLDRTALAATLDDAVGRLGPDAEWVEVPATPRTVPWRPAPSPAAEPVARTFTGDIDDSWQRASYTALTRPRRRPVVVGTPDAVPARTDEDDVEVAPTPTDEEQGLHLPLPLGRQPAGATFGTMVHAVLEHVDLTAEPLEAAVAAEVERQARRGGLTLEDPAGLTAGLVAAARTPLGPAFGQMMLAGTHRRDRLDELEFELPVAHGDGRISLAAIAGLLREHLDAGDPFVAYPDALEDRSLHRRVHGFLTGSIDLLLRRPGPDGPVFHVVDHKSNRLYGADDVGSTWHYRPAAMIAAMQRSHYVLQALLYQVALHRFLRWRQPGYDPAHHLGAVGYAFLRGMVGPSTPDVGGLRCGVLAWRPPAALVAALSDLLEEGR